MDAPSDLSLDASSLDRQRLVAWPLRFAGKRVLVVGDLVLDRYMVGHPTRLSREAPIPVLEYERAFDVPGAAANPATNLQALGGQASVAGIIGADEAGQTLVAMLQSAGIDTTAVVVDAARPTSTKTRVLAEHGLRVHQQVARIDRVDRHPFAAAVERTLVTHLQSIVPHVNAILLSDYKSGLVSDELITTCRTLAHQYGLLLTVDSQGDLLRFADFGIVKANQQETETVLGEPLRSEDDFRRTMLPLAKRLGARALVVTRGGMGLSVATAREYAHIPVVDPSEVFDVTGAGDTVIAVLTLALIAGAPLLDAAYLANFAAGLVVRRLGNATITPEDLSRTAAASSLWNSR